MRSKVSYFLNIEMLMRAYSLVANLFQLFSGFNAQMIGNDRSHYLVIEVNDMVKNYWYNIICELVDFILVKRHCMRDK